jgi:hypothetical protein
MPVRLVFIAGLLVATVNAATMFTIGTVPIPPDFWLSGFGSSEVYRGETFRLPPGPAALANSLTVFVGETSDLGASFHVLVTDVDTSTGFHPTNVMFESGTFNVPILTLNAFVVDLGGLLLQPGHEYAWILDYFVVGDPTAHVDMGTGLGSYPDGTPFSFPNGPTFPSGTRQSLFASNNWFVQQDQDFAFQLNLTAAVPEPAALLLCGLGLGALLIVRHRPEPTRPKL